MNEKPEIIEGNIAIDDRGNLRFCNDFNFAEKGIKRFYQVENIDKNIIRAFHAHIHEKKYVFVPKGCFKIICVKLNEDGGMGTTPEIFILSDKKPSILYIPKGYANGFKALKESGMIQFFSTSTLEESKGDDYRIDWNILGKEDIWGCKNR